MPFWPRARAIHHLCPIFVWVMGLTSLPSLEDSTARPACPAISQSAKFSAFLPSSPSPASIPSCRLFFLLHNSPIWLLFSDTDDHSQKIPSPLELSLYAYLGMLDQLVVDTHSKKSHLI
ncbi:hypothetical protein GGR52DRAFT_506512 [Hypoxylon sp. FL1284]|nr:hypothetical protein GGR52DRAFT_506512 [Hypoxylon sp. FL1284]